MDVRLAALKVGLLDSLEVGGMVDCWVAWLDSWMVSLWVILLAGHSVPHSADEWDG